MTDQAPISFDRPLWYLHADMWEPNKQTGQITSVDTHPTGRFATAGFVCYLFIISFLWQIVLYHL